MSLAQKAYERFLDQRDPAAALAWSLNGMLSALECRRGFWAGVDGDGFAIAAMEGFEEGLDAGAWIADLRRAGGAVVSGGVHLFPFFQDGRLAGCLGLEPASGVALSDLRESLEPALWSCSLLLRAWSDSRRLEVRRSATIAKEKSLELALDSVGDGYWDWNVREKSIYYSDAWLANVGWEAKDLVTVEQFMEIVHDDDRDALRASIREHLDGKTLKFEMAYRLRCKSGGYKDLLGRAKVIERDEFGQPLRVVGIVTDMTGTRRMQDQLVSAQKSMVESAKFSALGVMAAGIAHEINNPLAIIHAYTEVLENFSRLTPEKVEKSRRSIQRSVERISKIVKGLRKVARDGEDDPFESVALQALSDEILSFSSERLVNKGVDFRVDIQRDAQIWCQPVQVSQVLLNLINNSIDAIEGLESKWVSLKAYRRGRMVVIEFSDSGAGIPAHIQAKIFEPFFTTKQVGKGTGLGLSISRSIIEDHGGRFLLENGRGHTCFVIEIPAAAVGGVAAAS